MNWMPPDPPASTLTATSPAPPPPPPPPPPTTPVGSRLAGTLQGLLWAGAGCAAVGMVATVVSRRAYGEFLGADGATPATQRRLRQAWLDADAVLHLLNGLFVLAMLVVVILLMVWARRLYRTSALLWSGPRRWSAGWTIGGWFVPVANLVIPKLVLGEIEQILACRQIDGRTHAGWKSHTTSSAGWCWWALYVTGVVLLFVRPQGSAELEQFTQPEVRAFYVIHLLMMASWCASCVFGVFYVRRLTADARQVGG